MTGSHMVLAGAAPAAPTGGVGSALTITPPWANIYGTDSAFNAPATLGGIAAPLQIAATKTASGPLYFVKNGVTLKYSGGFSVAAGDTLAWGITLIFGGGNKSGTVRVSAAGVAVASFTYAVTDSGRGL